MTLSPEACRDKYPDQCSRDEANASWDKLQGGFQPEAIPGECSICVPYQIEKPGHECKDHIIALKFKYVPGCKICKDGELSDRKHANPCLDCEEKTVLVPYRVRVGGGFKKGVTAPFVVNVTWKNKIDEEKNECQKCVVQEGVAVLKDLCKEKNDASSAVTDGREYYECETQGDIKRCVKKCVEKECKFCFECKSSSTIRGDSYCDDKCDGFRKCLPPLAGGNPDCFCPNVTGIERDAPPLTEEQKEFYKPCPPDKPYLKPAREDGSGGCECDCDCSTKSNYECLVQPDGKALGCRCKFYSSDTPSGTHKPNSPAPNKNSEPCDVQEIRGKPKNKIVTTNTGCFCVPYDSPGPFSLDMIP